MLFANWKSCEVNSKQCKLLSRTATVMAARNFVQGHSRLSKIALFESAHVTLC